jgi:hypothetical protein
MESPISDFLYSLIHTLPFLFIYFIGLVLSFVFRRRLGRIWLVAGFAFLIHMLAMLVSIASQFFFYFGS